MPFVSITDSETKWEIVELNFASFQFMIKIAAHNHEAH